MAGYFVVPRPCPDRARRPPTAGGPCAPSRTQSLHRYLPADAVAKQRRFLPWRLSASAVLAAIVTATTVLVIAPGAAFADSASDLVAKTNSSRASNGLSGYSAASDLTSIAQPHAANMASSRSIYHNGSLGSEACCWRSIGENVGVGSSASAVHNAFMNSSPHRANILSSAFTEVGIGTARGSDGQLYVDEVFRQRMGGSTHA